MAKPTKDTKPIENWPEPDLSEWPTRNEACQRLKVSFSRLRRLVDKKELNPIQDENGVWHFNPDELDAALEVEKEVTLKEILASATQLAEQSQAHAEAFGKLMVPNSMKMFDLLFDELKDVRERAADRINALEEKLRQSFEDREAALSKLHERQLEMLEKQADLQIREDAWKFLRDGIIPAVLQSYFEGKSGNKVVTLLRSMNPTLLSALRPSLETNQWELLQGLLNEEQKAVLMPKAPEPTPQTLPE